MLQTVGTPSMDDRDIRITSTTIQRNRSVTDINTVGTNTTNYSAMHSQPMNHYHPQDVDAGATGRNLPTVTETEQAVVPSGRRYTSLEHPINDGIDRRPRVTVTVPDDRSTMSSSATTTTTSQSQYPGAMAIPGPNYDLYDDTASIAVGSIGTTTRRRMPTHGADVSHLLTARTQVHRRLHRPMEVSNPTPNIENPMARTNDSTTTTANADNSHNNVTALTGITGTSGHPAITSTTTTTTTGDESQVDIQPTRKYCDGCLNVVIICLLIGVIFGMGVGITTVRRKESSDSVEVETTVHHATIQRMDLLRTVLEEVVEDPALLDDTYSSQSRALSWLAKYDIIGRTLSDVERLRTRFILILLVDTISRFRLSELQASFTWLHECDWTIRTYTFGVQCNPSSNQVWGLHFSNANLQGSLPFEIGGLSRLRNLDLRNNALTGHLPDSLIRLTSLQSLRLPFNQLSGTFPWSVMSLPLKQVDISYNHFVGSLPSNIGLFSRLEYLNASGNQVSGTLPASMGNLTDLHNLDLAGNHVWTSLSGNGLSGVIPDSLANLTNIETIDLSYNGLDGALPASWGRLTELRQLQLNSNFLEGALPASWGEVTLLEHLHISGNHLEGTVPTEFARMSSLSSLLMRHNDLTGDVNFLCASVSTMTFDCSEVTCECCSNC